jgi:hypothetical protein
MLGLVHILMCSSHRYDSPCILSIICVGTKGKDHGAVRPSVDAPQHLQAVLLAGDGLATEGPISIQCATA